MSKKYYGLIMPRIYGTGDVRIESIEQTSTSKESGGENVITETLMNGNVTQFTVRNGQGLKSTSQSESTDDNGLRSNTVLLESSDTDILADVEFTVKDGVGIKSHTVTESTDEESGVIKQNLKLQYTDGSSDDIEFLDATSSLTGLKSDIDAEISAETTARETADTTLQANIDSEATTRGDADSALDTRVTAAESAITTLNGTGDGSVTKTVTDKIAEVVADAPEDFDTLKEISDWISGHEEDASAMNTAIKANAEAIDTKLDKTTGTENAGKAVVVGDDGTLGFGTAGIDTDAVKTLIKENAADADYDESTTIKDKLDSIGSKTQTLTKAEYDALVEAGTVDEDTVYFVTDDTEDTESSLLSDTLIDDTASSTEKTYSSSKIEEKVDLIDDSASSATKTYSSSKIEEKLDKTFYDTGLISLTDYGSATVKLTDALYLFVNSHVKNIEFTLIAVWGSTLTIKKLVTSDLQTTFTQVSDRTITITATGTCRGRLFKIGNSTVD